MNSEDQKAFQLLSTREDKHDFLKSKLGELKENRQEETSTNIQLIAELIQLQKTIFTYSTIADAQTLEEHDLACARNKLVHQLMEKPENKLKNYHELEQQIIRETPSDILNVIYLIQKREFTSKIAYNRDKQMFKLLLNTLTFTEDNNNKKASIFNFSGNTKDKVESNFENKKRKVDDHNPFSIPKFGENLNQSNRKKIPSDIILNNSAVFPDPPADLSCAICKFDYTSPMIVTCGHSFCEDCIKQYIDVQNKLFNVQSCPICNKTIVQEGWVKDMKLVQAVNEWRCQYHDHNGYSFPYNRDEFINQNLLKKYLEKTKYKFFL